MRDGLNYNDIVDFKNEMQQVKLSEQIVYGCLNRSNFFNELNITTSKVPSLIKEFKSLTFSNDILQNRFVIYSEFDNEIPKEYNISIASSKKEYSNTNYLVPIKIYGGNYLKLYLGTLNHEQIIEKWLDVVLYFSQSNCKFTRAYRSDFEYHNSEGKIYLYISIL